MLNGTPIARDAAGRLKNLPAASFPSPNFNGGTPLSTLQEVVFVDAVGAFSHGGLRYTAAGALAVDTVGVIVQRTPAGLPLAAGDRLAVSINQPVASVQNNIPYDAAGRVAFATTSSLLNLSGFDTGFDEQAFY